MFATECDLYYIIIIIIDFFDGCKLDTVTLNFKYSKWKKEQKMNTVVFITRVRKCLLTFYVSRNVWNVYPFILIYVQTNTY